MFWLVLGSIFISIALLTYGVLNYWENRRKVKARFEPPRAESAIPILRPKDVAGPGKKMFIKWLSSSGKWALKDQEEVSKVRTTLVHAGYRHPNAPAIYFGIRALIALLLPIPLLSFFILKGKVTLLNLMLAFLVSGVGFFLPTYVLTILSRKRQASINKALPDVLDLFIICMDAGLSLNATINRVAEEIRGVYNDFYSELQITTAEIRTGIPWNEALDNLSQRTGVQSVQSMVGLMIQSEKLGASIGQALRTHAYFIRTQRALKVEEKAAKLPVKILFPLMFFILPAMFVVVVGPALIHITKSLLPALGAK